MGLDAARAREAYEMRLERVFDRMGEMDVGAMVLSLGADLPWLSGYQAMPLERLTALVVRCGEQPILIVPALEAPRVTLQGELFKLRPWWEYEDPHELVSLAISGCEKIGISDRTWAVSLLQLQKRTSAAFVPASQVTRSLRSVKDTVEVSLLREAGSRTDRVAEAIIGGEVVFIGRTERQISMEISERLLSEGLERVNFSIVGSGANSASPHHEPSGRVVGPNEAVVCDFGGEFRTEYAAGYCSDITRTVVTGKMPERFTELYSVLETAQARQLKGTRAGITCETLDDIGRSYIDECGYGEYFIHRTGHGIGIEEHEEPYIVSGNSEPILPGNAFSVEPGIYIPKLYGARIEDIVVATEDGCELINHVDRSLHQVV